MNNSDNRYLFVDWTKVIGIYLVVVGHCALFPKEIVNCIYAFHMPLFFLIGGMMEKQLGRRNRFLTGIRSLLVPYAIYYSLSMLYKLARTFFAGEDSISYLIKSVAGLFLGIGYNTDVSICAWAPGWFLVAFYIVRVVFSLVRSKQQLILLNIVSICLILVLHTLKIDLYWSIDSALLALPFYSVGYVCKNIMLRTYPVRGSLAIIVISALLFTGCYIFNGTADMNSMNYGANLLLFYAAGTSAGIFILECCKHIRIYVTANSNLLILGLHAFALAFVQYIISRMGVPIEGAFGGFVICTLSQMLLMALTPLCQKYLPILLGK